MKKLFPYIIVLLCLTAAVIPALAAQSETAQAEAPLGTVLDGGVSATATPTDIEVTPTPKPVTDASDSDITIVYTGTARPTVKVGEEQVDDSVTAKVGEPVTFTVINPAACRLFYESRKLPMTALDAVKVSDDTYTFRIGLCWKNMTVTVGVAGDINGDGVLNADDYDVLKSRLSTGTTLVGITALLADVNGDGEINTADLTAIKAQTKDIRDIEW